MKKIIVLSLALLVLLAAAVASAAPKASDSCQWIDMSEFMSETIVIDQECLGMNMDVTGTFIVEGGWTFSEVRLNGTPIETTEVEGELALQVDPFSMEVSQGDTLVWEVAVPDAEGAMPELGLKYILQDPTCKTAEVGFGVYQDTSWKWERHEAPCVEVTYAEDGYLGITGWAFNAPVYFNGDIAPTSPSNEPGTADEIQLIDWEVTEDTTVEWRVTMPTAEGAMAELGLTTTYIDLQCQQVVIDEGNQTVTQQWEPHENPCLEMSFDIPGTLYVESGWVFEAPLFVNDEEVPTSRVPNETADQVDPINFEVVGDTKLVWLVANPNLENTPELGLNMRLEKKVYMTYLPVIAPPQEPEPTPQICREVELVQGAGLLQMIWEGDHAPCVTTISPINGTLNIVGGWVFNAPLYLNEEVMPTHYVEGEQAAQIGNTTINVEAGQILIWEPTPTLTGNAELGVRYNLTGNPAP